jgi:outer membrane protein assembly factor BamB
MLAPAVLALALAANDPHWPQFRGPGGDGVAVSAAPVEFGPDKNVVWKTAVPFGHSSPVIAGDRIFLTGEEGAARSGPVRGYISSAGTLVTLAIDRRNGEILWRRAAPRPRQDSYQPTNSAASPSAVTDGRSVFVFFGDFGLLAYTVAGEEKWRLPLGPFNNANGHGASPILWRDRLFLVCDQDSGSFLIAVDKESGKLLWRVARPEVTRAYSTPVVYEPKSGPAELIVPGAFLLTAYNASSGEKLWWVRGQSWQPKSLPLVAGDIIYAHSWESGGEAEEPTETPAFAEVRAQWDSNGDGKLQAAELPDERMRRSLPQNDMDLDGALDERDWNFYRARRSARNRLVAVRGGGRGDVTESRVLWSMNKFLPNVPSPLLYQGVMYLIKDGGVLTALDPATGKLHKQDRLAAAIGTYYSSPVAAAGRVYFLSQQGKATVVKAGANWEVVTTNDLEEDCFATPAIVDGRMYLRTRTTLYCFAGTR